MVYLQMTSGANLVLPDVFGICHDDVDGRLTSLCCCGPVKKALLLTSADGMAVTCVCWKSGHRAMSWTSTRMAVHSDLDIDGEEADAPSKFGEKPAKRPTRRNSSLERHGLLTKESMFVQIDLRDKEALQKVFASTKFDAVIHFAGLKAVSESVQKPLLYYNNNLIGTITLLEVMGAHGCKKLVFSSSATVYGWPKEVPCTEEFPLCATNPYGRTKLFIEEICRDIYCSDSGWKIILLRYFNPVGAHHSGYIGEDPRGIPNNLMPFAQQVAVGRRPALTVFGNDYSTKDGTGVRDYIHVVDLSDGHIAALQKLFDGSKIGCEVYNLGTGKGTSVLEMVAAFEKASGKKIPLVMAGRRPGDAEIVYASTIKAEEELNWKAKYGIEEMCRDQWNWASKNPWGYRSPDS